MTQDDELLRKFIDTFVVFDELWIHEEFETTGDVTPLLSHPWDEEGWSYWRPVAESLSRDVLRELYREVPGPLPPLYERLILSYRWAQADVDRLTLLSNLPPGLMSLASAINRDQGLVEMLIPAGFVKFGRGPDVDYDPVCFDLGHRATDGDCRIVKFDHEEILCNRRLVEVGEVAPSFRRLVELVIDDAERKLGSG
jgi:hypothetical protein